MPIERIKPFADTLWNANWHKERLELLLTVRKSFALVQRTDKYHSKHCETYFEAS